jgi:FAD-dependent urate hydroxylase
MSGRSDVAIIGAGPYGLSLAAHLRDKGIEHRIVGEPMQFWSERMPRGMLLKSDGFASTLYDPKSEFTLKRYCEEQNIEYADLGTPVRVEDFCAYGLAFQRRFAPGLENKRVTLLDCTRSGSGFTLELSDGKSFAAKKVVVATGLSGFEFVPPELTSLPNDLWSHCSAHVHLERFKGRDVTVLGGGASATELATLLHEAGCQVRMVSRRQSIQIHTRLKLPRSLAQRIRWPISPVGPGWKSRFLTDLPHVFHRFPQPVRSRIAKGFLGPAGGWFLRGRFDRVPLLAGYQIMGAEAADGRAILQLKSANGDEQRIETEHVIAATGYRADVRRLAFLGTGISSQLNSSGRVLKLSSHFESSVPGLFFVGPVGIDSFGPVLRFACGAKFTARRLSNHLARVSQTATRRITASAREHASFEPQ